MYTHICGRNLLIIIVPFLLYDRSVNQKLEDEESTGSTDRCTALVERCTKHYGCIRYGKLEYQFLDTFCDDGPLIILVVEDRKTMVLINFNMELSSGVSFILLSTDWSRNSE